jgi:hypothetical protein
VSGDRSGTHVDLERLADYAEGALTPAEAADVESHLADCLACRVEEARLRRFLEIDEDESLIGEADWPRARAALDAAFRRTMLPSLSREREAPRLRLPRSARPRVWWPVPVAAAAALLAAIVSVERLADERDGFLASEPVRGGARPQQEIVPVSPSGEQHSLPVEFAWRTASAYDSLAIEVHSPELDLVFRAGGITRSPFALTDSLRALLVPGNRYIWNVQGFRGAASTASPHAWFSVPPSGIPE